jgi:AraC-like DNA-binding protein
MKKNTYKDAYVPKLAPEKLRPYIRRFMIVDHQENTTETIHPKPTGYNYLNWLVKGHWQAEFSETFSSKAAPIFFAGQIKNENITVTQTGFFKHIVAEFTALGFYQLTGIKGIACTNKLRVPEFFNDQLAGQFNRVLEQAAQLPDPENNADCLSLLEELFLQMSDKPYLVPDYLTCGIEKIEQAHGSINIEVLCKSLQISQRQFNRKFTEIVGLSPKFFSRVLQMNKALQALLENDRGYLCDIANEAGYYDESHFAHAIQEFFGDSPSHFLNSRQETLFSFLGRSRAYLKS